MAAGVMQEPVASASAQTRIQSIRRRWFLVFVVSVCILGVVLYWPSLYGPRLFDDEVMLSDSGRYRTIADLISSLNWMRPETRPLVRLTFGLESLLFGDSMFVHRLGNILTHCLAAAALYGLVRRVEQQIVPANLEKWESCQIAFAVAILWFVHPLQTAAVAYVAQRGESLMGLFFFLYLRCLVELIATGTLKWLVLTGLIFSLGLLSKTIMITAPVVGLLLDRGFFSETWKDVFRNQWKLLLFPAVGSLFAIALLLPGVLRGDANVGFGGEAPPVEIHLAAQAKVLWLYAFQCVWPQWLSVDHALRPPQYISDHLGWILLSIMLLSAIGAIYCIGRCAVGFLLLAPLCVLAVTSSIIPTADLWVDHRMYVPLASAMALLVVAIRQFLYRLHGPVQTARILPIAMGTLALALSARTWSRAEEYGSGAQIWRSAISENPDNDRAVQNLIDATRKEAAESRILPVLEEALRSAEESGIVPTVALGRLGEQYTESGEPEKAVSLLERAIRLDEQHFFEGYRGARRNTERFGMHVNIGLALASLGQLSSASDHLNRAFNFADNSADARALAGSLSLQIGEIKTAADHFERALELRPGWKDVEEDLERIRGLK